MHGRLVVWITKGESNRERGEVFERDTRCLREERCLRERDEVFGEREKRCLEREKRCSSQVQQSGLVSNTSSLVVVFVPWFTLIDLSFGLGSYVGLLRVTLALTYTLNGMRCYVLLW